MAQLTVELEDRELQQLRASARARNLDPGHLTKAELYRVLALRGDKKYQKRFSVKAARSFAVLGHVGIQQLIHAITAVATNQAPANARTQQQLHATRKLRLYAGLQRAKQSGADIAPPDQAAPPVASSDDAEQLWRAKRLAAVMSMHGIWKGDPTKPQDGAEYQREIRAEWR